MVFLITGKQPSLKEQNFSPDILQYISKEEMKIQDDVFEWACHTHNLHFRNSAFESALLTSSIPDLVSDLCASKHSLNETKHFCFPFGQYNQIVIDELAKVGFRYLYTTDVGGARADSTRHIHLIPRFNISPRMSLHQFAKLVEGQSSTSFAQEIIGE